MHRAVSIRPQDPYAGVFQSFEEFYIGMPVGILLTSGYDSDTRLYGRKEFRHRRILTSVMADLKYIGAHCLHAILGKNFAFHLFFSVSREQDRLAAEVQPQHQRIVVLC